MSRANLTAVFASELGCALDGVTDDIAIINAYLAPATVASPRTLIYDGFAYQSSAILIPNGGVSIFAWNPGYDGFLMPGNGTDNGITIGLFQTGAGSNYDTGNPACTPPGGPVPAPVSNNVTINGLRIEGNRTNGKGTLHFPIDVVGANNLRLSNITINDSQWYNIRLNNVHGAIIDGCRIMSYSLAQTFSAPGDFTGPVTNNISYAKGSTDGIHVCGYCEDINITNCHFRTGDDGIALNSAEGYGGYLRRVSISNCTFDMCASFVRVYGGDPTGEHLDPTSIVKGVSIMGLSGTAFVTAFIFGNGALGQRKDVVSDVVIDGVTAFSPYFVCNSSNIGALTLTNWNWTGCSANASGVWVNMLANIELQQVHISGRIVRDPVSSAAKCIFNDQWAGDATLFPFVQVAPYAGTVIYREITFGALMLGTVSNTTTDVAYSTPVSLFAYSPNTSIVHATVEGPLDTRFFTLLSGPDTTRLNSGSLTGKAFAGMFLADGSGNVATFPDAAFTEGSMYRSSNASGALSMTIGGAARRINLT